MLNEMRMLGEGGTCTVGSFHGFHGEIGIASRRSQCHIGVKHLSGVRTSMRTSATKYKLVIFLFVLE